MKLKSNDIVIRRVHNGWVAYEVSDETSTQVRVYEDDPSMDTASSADSFGRLLWEHFPHLSRSKRMSGLDFNLHKSYTSQDEAGD